MPGITAIKAGQLVAFLRGEAERVVTPAPAKPVRTPAPAPARRPQPLPPRSARPPKSHTAVGAASETPRPVEATASPYTSGGIEPIIQLGEMPLVQLARRVAKAATALLGASGAPSYDRSFARQIGKIAVLAERIALEADASTGTAERTAAQLRKMEQLLADIAVLDSVSAKRQERYAEEMRERRHKLQDVFDAVVADPDEG